MASASLRMPGDMIIRGGENDWDHPMRTSFEIGCLIRGSTLIDPPWPEDAWEQDVYQAELEIAMDDLVEGASDFRGDGPEVHQGFWEGVQDGLDA